MVGLVYERRMRVGVSLIFALVKYYHILYRICLTLRFAFYLVGHVYCCLSSFLVIAPCVVVVKVAESLFGCCLCMQVVVDDDIPGGFLLDMVRAGGGVYVEYVELRLDKLMQVYLLHCVRLPMDEGVDYNIVYVLNVQRPGFVFVTVKLRYYFMVFYGLLFTYVCLCGVWFVLAVPVSLCAHGTLSYALQESLCVLGDLIAMLVMLLFLWDFVSLIACVVVDLDLLHLRDLLLFIFGLNSCGLIGCMVVIRLLLGGLVCVTDLAGCIDRLFSVLIIVCYGWFYCFDGLSFA
eukprot:gene2916-1898_t